MARRVVIGPVTVRQGPAGWCVTADVDGHPLWFDCLEVRLDASAEAFASAVLLTAVESGRRLRISDPVSAEWRSNTLQLMEVWREWWGYPVVPPKVADLPVPRSRANGTVLCFTGGVDSFHSLLCSEPKPNMLAFVHGYDIPLVDKVRMSAWESSLREVAAAVGSQVCLLRSNLREHPYASRSNWERAHGGALAAVGHLLAPLAGTLRIASSFPMHYGYHWGSHARIDPLWSSDRLKIVHDGGVHSRVDKMRAIAGHELVQRHLRVCWENHTPIGNCSCCDKCLCTMATIAACGQTGCFRTFDWPASLADSLNRLPQTRFVRTYGELLCMDLAPDLTLAIRTLLERSAGRPYMS